jgi:hypothetical protein
VRGFTERRLKKVPMPAALKLWPTFCSNVKPSPTKNPEAASIAMCLQA